MASLSRVWFVLPPGPGDAISDVVERLTERPLAALAFGPGESSAALAVRLGAGRAPAAHRLAAATLEGLDGLSARHCDLELAVVAGPELLLQAIARALGTPTRLAVPAQPRPGSLSAFHWPTGIDPEARAELIGLDLDWFPPWHPGQKRSRFPGGPGVAGSART